jgi:C1A family cysteine protease
MSRKYNLIVEHTSPPGNILFKASPKIALTKVDLSSNSKLVVYDQGYIGSCTANALSSAYQFENSGVSPSRLFLYYNERMLDGGDISEDDGSTLSCGIRVLQSYGVCQENYWPYKEENYTIKPPKAAYTNAKLNRAVSVARVTPTLNGMKACLAAGIPFVFGFKVYSPFESDAVARTGMVPMPTRKDSSLGGHAVLCVGFDDSTQYFKVLNSWGPNWGDRGYFYLPYAYMTNTSLVSDLWAIKTVTAAAKIARHSGFKSPRGILQ